MKSKRLSLLVVLSLMVVILLETCPVTAQAILSEYTVKDFPAGFIYYGDWKLFPNEGNHFWGQVVFTIEAASDPRLSGIGLLIANGNLDPTGPDQIWGTLTMAVTDSASCQGSV